MSDSNTVAASLSKKASSMGSMMRGLSDISPIVITGFTFMSSVFNYDIKAIVWLIPLVMWLFLMKLIQSNLIKDNEVDPALKCNTIWGKYKSPSLSSFFIMYTLGYIAAPMPVNDDWNIMAILFFAVLFGIDATARMGSQCSTMSGVAVGGVGGLLIGVLMYFVISWIGMGKYLYYTTANTNNVYCSKPKEQNFKCYVYKNGNIISSI